MKQARLLSALRSRSRREHLEVLALVGAALCLIQILTAPFRPSLVSLVVFFLLPFAVLVLSPIPWQWTGDDRLKASIPRGLLQAILFNGAWIAPGLLLRGTPTPQGPSGIPPHGTLAAVLGLVAFSWVVATGFGWIWAEKEATAALLRERLEGLVAERTEELSQKTRELEGAMEALHDQTLTDPLTGLRNRRYLSLTIPDDVAQVFRAQRALTISDPQRLAMNIDMVFLMVDLDHFKAVNDEYGHAVGDLVLRQVGDVLRKAVRDSDSVIRWGGEEFMVVARNSCRADSHVLAERIRKQINDTAFDIGQEKVIHRTCSVGYVVYPLMLWEMDSLRWEEAMELADKCLYAAKRGGRNAWVGLTPKEGLDLGQVSRTSWLDLEQGLRQGLFEVQTSLAPGQELTWGDRS